MRQKGGAVTYNDRTLTAEQILDKFTLTYFDKHEIRLDPSIYSALASLIAVSDPNNYYKLFDSNLNLLINDSEITHEGIDSRIYYGVSTLKHTALNGTETSQRTPNGKAIIHLEKTPYSISLIYNGITKNILLLHPILEKQVQRNNTDPLKWKLYVKNPQTMAEQDLGFQFEAPSLNAALSYILRFTEMNEEIAGIVSGFAGVNSPFSYNPDTAERIDISPKIMFVKKENDPTKLIPIYCEQDSRNPLRYKFHPHNFLNFLPREEELLKGLFVQIKDKLNELTEDGYVYRLVPDKFYHIHVGNIPGERTICLTIHGAFEDNTLDPPKNILNDYIYVDTEGNQIRLGRSREPRFILNTQPNDLQESDLKETWKKNRRLHSAYILLKPETEVHPLYKLSTRSQVGNPFLTSLSNYRSQLVAPYTNFPLAEFAFANTVFDLNHVKGKGVMVSMNTNQCVYFCEETLYWPTDDDVPSIKDTLLQSLLFNNTFSDPIRPEELQTYMRTIPGYLDTLNFRRNENEYRVARSQQATTIKNFRPNQREDLMFKNVPKLIREGLRLRTVNNLLRSEVITRGGKQRKTRSKKQKKRKTRRLQY